MLTHEGKARSFSENASLAVALSGVAGAVNATGFFVVGTYTSHVTGHVAAVGDELAQGHMPLAFDALVLLLSFLLGAMTATVLVMGSRRVGGKGHYKGTLILEAAVLALFTALSVGTGPRPMALQLALTAMLCFAMGLQNALVTKISGAVVRTTHLTGITTDFGIEIVRLWFWYHERAKGLGIPGKIRQLRRSVGDPELHQAWLHFSIFISFFTGATVGPILYLQRGHLAMALPCLVLLLLVGMDIAKQRRTAISPATIE